RARVGAGAGAVAQRLRDGVGGLPRRARRGSPCLRPPRERRGVGGAPGRGALALSGITAALADGTHVAPRLTWWAAPTLRCTPSPARRLITGAACTGAAAGLSLGFRIPHPPRHHVPALRLPPVPRPHRAPPRRLRRHRRPRGPARRLGRRD